MRVKFLLSRTGTEPEDTGKTTLHSRAAQDAAADAKNLFIEDPDELEKETCQRRARKLLPSPLYKEHKMLLNPAEMPLKYQNQKAHVIHPTGQGKRYNIKGGSAASE